MNNQELHLESAFVAIVGRPNVGKSTLLNRILGQKISITSRKPQTTRHRILGIETEGSRQIVYVDTPGLHQDEKRAINRMMNRAATSSLSGVDAVLFVVEAGKWTSDDALVLNKLKQLSTPIVVVVNKIDQVKDKATLLPYLEEFAQRHAFAEIIPVSAATGTQVETLREQVHKYARPGVVTSWYYPYSRVDFSRA